MRSGRFSQATAELLRDFSESISFDKRLYKYDILGSKAHAKALQAYGILTKEELDLITKNLDEIAEEIVHKNFKFRTELEDIHMNIESALTERIGSAGAKLHTARSRNDQIALDLRLFCRDFVGGFSDLVRNLQRALLDFARKNSEIFIPGYTHLQRAQPVLLAHHILAYIEMLERDRDRASSARGRIDVMPLGSGALAGSTINLDRELIASELGFSKISTNSMDAISDRDFVAEVIFLISLNMVHLSRFCEDLVLWNSSEFGFVEISDAYATGSSLMPQKKNPDIAELVRGKSGRVFGDLMAILTLLKGLPMTYNRDLQEDKPPLFDAVDTVSICLKILTELVGNLHVVRARCDSTVSDELLLATDIADYLVKKGMAFRTAHKVVGELTSYCLKRGGGEFSEMALGEWRKFSDLFSEDVYDIFDVRKSAKLRANVGSPSPARVAEEFKRWEAVL